MKLPDAKRATSDRPRAASRHAGVVVVTGGSSGIGRCTASLFASLGWSVGLISRSSAALQAAYADILLHGSSGAMEQADVGDLEALERAARSIELQLGPIDVWINCAGNATFSRFIDTSPDEFVKVTEVTYNGTVNGTRIALSRMLPQDKGHIINVCSAIAYLGMPLLAAYSGAKHAVRGFSQSLQAELAQEGSQVRVTTVFPPAVNTPFFDHAISRMGRMGRPLWPVYQPEVVAKAIWLALLTPCAEMPISFTTVFFSLFTRMFPKTIRRLIKLIGYEGQLADEDTSLRRYRPTVFHASRSPSSIHGGFGAGARSYSFHLVWLRAWHRAKHGRPSGYRSRPARRRRELPRT